MGCRGGFSRKMQKTGGGGGDPNETRVNKVFFLNNKKFSLDTQPESNAIIE